MAGNGRSSTSERIVWDNDLVGALIEEVHLNEVVWNIASPLYKNKNAQEAAWEKISANIGLEGRPLCVRTKWRDLRDTYRKKLKAMSPKSGHAGGAKKLSWPWMKAMEFSKRLFNIHVATFSNFEECRSNEIGEEETQMNSTVDATELGFSMEPYIDNSLESIDYDVDQEEENVPVLSGRPTDNTKRVDGKINVKDNSYRKRKRREMAVSNAVDLAILAELQSPQGDKKEDEDSLFLKSLVPQLKRLHSKTKAKAKCQMQQLLFDYEFGEE